MNTFQLPSKKVLGFSVYTGSVEQIPLSQKMLVNTLNQYCYCMAVRDEAYKQALHDSDILLADGVGVVAAAKFLNGTGIKKIAGADLHQYLLEQLNENGGSCFYMGSSQHTLDKIKERLQKEYPNVRVGLYSPPFKKEFSEADNKQMTDAVNEFKPDVLFVGMTAPKQEKWASLHKDVLNTKLICSIGAVFDFYAGTVKRPSSFWVSMGMEWLVRLWKEPKRMWRRYLYYGPDFIFTLMRMKLMQLKTAKIKTQSKPY
ncbi:MAG TPA: WecB/TagA/CpsF family glycosyltransferase [Chitinophagaceae bacterium]|nr:WecB/TagA/CpsF family glycosyltransferase [Chitinophagaceae bacterium]